MKRHELKLYNLWCDLTRIFHTDYVVEALYLRILMCVPVCVYTCVCALTCCALVFGFVCCTATLCNIIDHSELFCFAHGRRPIEISYYFWLCLAVTLFHVGFLILAIGCPHETNHTR